MFDAVAVAPFIAEKRLVVLSGIPKVEKEQIQQIQQIIHPAVLLLIIEPKPDKRLSATKELLNIADIKTCTLLKGVGLQKWLQEFVQSLGSQIDQSQAKNLIAHVGEDQMLLASEAGKIATYATDRAITSEDIETLVMLSTEQAGWKLMDLIAAGKEKEALQFAQELLKRGENPYALWSRMVWMVTQLVAVAACVEEGNANPANIAKSAGVPFPTARTLVPLARKTNTVSLRKVLEQFADADIGLKTGKFRSTVDATDEITALIDTCITKLCIN